jgi:hypothetical protein
MLISTCLMQFHTFLAWQILQAFMYTMNVEIYHGERYVVHLTMQRFLFITLKADINIKPLVSYRILNEFSVFLGTRIFFYEETKVIIICQTFHAFKSHERECTHHIWHSVQGITFLGSLENLDPGFEYYSRHGCLRIFRVCFALFCGRANHPSKKCYKMSIRSIVPV